jgi:uncharacterized protein (TIGR02996 family)
VIDLALEATILAAPDDPAGYLVLADWLQTRGDPRGELIVLHHRESDQAAAHLAQHAEAFLGRFAASRPEVFELEWRLGFIRSANIGWEMFGGEDEEDPSSAQLAAFLALPSARFLEKLSLGPTAHEEELMLDELTTPIEEAALPNLRELYLGDTSDWDISSTYTRMPTSASIPQMRRLTLRGGYVTLDEAIDLPALTSFTVQSGSLGTDSLKAIAAARWPELESLEIWFGEPRYGASGGIADIQPILDAAGLGKLRHLALRNCSFADELATALAGSKILPQLASVDLSMGNLSDRGVQTMLADVSRFSHLEKLDLDDNALTNASWPAARPLAKTVAFGNRHEPDRAVPRTEDNRYRRYVSVGE